MTITKAECLKRAEEAQAEAMKQAQAWALCGEGDKALDVLAKADEEAKIYRMLARMHPMTRGKWLIENWGRKAAA